MRFSLNLPLSILMVGFSFILNAQQNSLLPNGGFEEIELDTSYYSDSQHLGLFQVNDTSLFWNRGDRGLMNVQCKNWAYPNYHKIANNTNYSDSGYAKTGKLFCLITPFLMQQSGYLFRQNMIGKLCHKLINGNSYTIEFYTKVFMSDYFTDNIYVYAFKKFEPTRIFIEDYNKTNKATTANLSEPIFQFPLISDSVSYTKISFHFTAKGDEEFIYIGNLNSSFCKNCFTSFQNTKKPRQLFIRYAIDDFSVTPLDSNEKCTTLVPILESYNNSILPIEIAFDEVTFDYNKATLNPTSFYSLDSIANYLLHTKASILIIGYTDETGTEEYNKKLSELRAKSVYYYLLKRGVPENNVTYIGNGVLNKNVAPELKRKVRYIITIP